MKIILRQTPVYRFLWHCEQSNLEKKVLDCGAGGQLPPLSIFKLSGYETHGVEISDTRVDLANNFAKKHDLELNIIEGDMRNLPYEDQSFSFVYSYNTIFHMTKKDIKKCMEEIKRVIKKGGLIYVNFLSKDDGLYGKGKELEPGEFVQVFGNEEVLHTIVFEEDFEELLDGFEIIYYSKKTEEMPQSWEDYTTGYYDIICQKK